LREFVEELKFSIQIKPNKSDIDKIYDEFQRFALYDDYKDLYEKCVPAISGFEN